MPLKPGSSIKSGEFLSNDDYIQSPNGLFFAIMQSDGNFCVYRGSPSENHGFLWGCNQTSLPGGPYYAVLQRDANFCVYKGTGPEDYQGGIWCSMGTGPEGAYVANLQDDGNFCVYHADPRDGQKAIWCTMAIDPVVDVEIATIDYDVAAARILNSSPAELYRQQVSNHTMQTQASSISGSQSVSETSGWSDSLGVKVGVKTTFKTGLPFVAEGKVEVSTELSNTFTWSGSTTNTKTWAFNTPLSVPPQATMVAIVAATISTITVPYTLNGTLTLKSGTRMLGQIKGIYTGTNSHDLTVTFVQLIPQVQEVTTSSQPLPAKATLTTGN